MQHSVYNADNLVFLDHLIKEGTREQSVDLCYIDPPYNTGNSKSFVYTDKFKKDDSRSKHEVWSDWLEERLVKSLPLLKDTAVVAVSIDDKEVHYLRLLLDKVFGENNFIAQIVVDGGNMKNNARFISTSHEYLLVYAKNLAVLSKSEILWRQERDGLAIIRRQETKLRKKHKTDYATISTEMKAWLKTVKVSPRLKMFHGVDKRGLFTYADLSAPSSGQRYDVLHPDTWQPVTIPSRGWGLTEDKMQNLLLEDGVIFGEGVDGHLKQPLKKLYLKDGKDQVIRSVLSYPARTSTHMLEKILGERGLFNNPKNLDLMKFLVDTMCPENGVVLDYFAGSATTGHAVLDLNSENPDIQRSFILCTNNENGIYDKVTRPRLETVLTGQWKKGKPHPPKVNEKINYYKL